MQQESARLAKITRPIITEVLQREHLFDLLERMQERPVIWVSGPAGCGKSTLVNSYLYARGHPCLWYQMDEGDNDPATFFYYLGLAAKKAAPGRRKPLPLFKPEYLPSISSFTLRYFENLYQRLKIPCFLVFDNYQDVPADSPFHELILHGLSGIPEGIHLVLISRHDPPSAFIRLRANQQMHILGRNELRLTLEESKGIALLLAKEAQPKGKILQLHHGVDGWAAGLVLVLEIAKREDIDFDVVVQFGAEEIFDYFAGEVFDKIDPEIQEFLLKTALLTQMTVRMTESLTGISYAHRILSSLYRGNYFTERRFHSMPSYQYHPLFKRFLLARSQERFAPDVFSALQRRAAALLEEADQKEAAVQLLHDAGDWDGMCRLLMKLAPEMLAQGRNRLLEEWLGRLPQELAGDVPWLSYWMGSCLLPFNPSSSQCYFEQAFERFKTQGDKAGVFLAWAGIIFSIFYALEDFTPLDQWIQVLEGLMEEFKDFPSEEIGAHVVSAMFSALTLRQQGHPEIETWAERAFSLIEGPFDIGIKVQTLHQLVLYHLSRGNYKTAALAVEALKRLAISGDTHPLAKIQMGLSEAMYFNLTGSHKNCMEAVSDALELSRTTGIHIMDHMLLGHRIWSTLNENDLVSAGELLERLASSLSGLKPWDKSFYHFLRSREAFFRRDLDQADLHAGLALEILERVGAPWNSWICHLLKALVMHELGKQLEAEEHLGRAFHLADLSKSKIMEFQSLMIKARFSLDRGKIEPGLLSLRKALALGKKLSFFAITVEHHGSIARLFAKALEEGIEVEYAQEFIRRNNLILDQSPLHLENWPWALKIFTLGRFQLLRNERPVRFSRKAQEKPLSLLRALIALGGREVQEGQIADFLWPDADGDIAHSSFKTTLHRLRKLIGEHEAIQVQGGRLTLNQRYCWVDVWALEHILGQADEEWRKAPKTDKTAKAIELTQKVLDLYQGPFMKGTEEPWAISFRERLQANVMRGMEWLGHYWEGVDQMEKAIACYQQGLVVDKLSEKCYQRLMLCLKQMGRKAESLAIYDRCKKNLAANLGIEPSPVTQDIRRSLLSE
jgi:LuxR family maltose regulon positive regulatory protein